MKRSSMFPVSRLAVVTVVLVLAALSGMSATASPLPPPGGSIPPGGAMVIHVAAAWVAITANQSPAPMAEEAGYFTQQGLAVDLRYIGGSEVGMAALVSGEIQFLQTAGAAVVNAVAGGARVRMVAGFINIPVFVAMTAPALTQPAQLKGTTWAVTRIGNADYFALLDMLQHFGVGPNDIRIIQAANPPGQVAAVVSGQAQGIMVSPPNNVLAEQKAGMRQFFDTARLGLPEQNAGLAVSETYARTHPGTVERFIRACIQGIWRFKTDRAFAEQVMRKYFKYTDPTVLAAGYNAYATVFPKVPYPTTPGMERVIGEVATRNPRAKSLKASDLIDRRYLDAIVDSGFIQRVYGP